ncbi:MAG: hypothetical protein EKK33_21465 [Bradyrhizobiaceae bacterium]|nr:MAG: hypothetical protein EKK33_21465 [Bradyrhizobiaceae bacterium]
MATTPPSPTRPRKRSPRVDRNRSKARPFGRAFCLGCHSRHSGAREARTTVRNCAPENPFVHRLCRPIDSGLVLRTPRNDGR